MVGLPAPGRLVRLQYADSGFVPPTFGPTGEVVKQVDFGHPMVSVGSDRPLDPQPDRILFERGKTRTIRVVVVNRPPTFGTRYAGKVEVAIESPAGIVVRPDRLTIDLTDDPPSPTGGGAAREVSIEVAADAQPGRLKLTASPTAPPSHSVGYKHTAEFSFAVR